MALEEMSPNVQETDNTGRKRSHDEFSGDARTENDNGASPGSSPLTEPGSTSPGRASSLSPKPAKNMPETAHTSSSKSSTTISTTQSTDTSSSAPKRKRLTAAEKEARDKEAMEKKKEREERIAVKAAQKAKEEEEKATRAKERDEKRKKKDEEEKAKAQQREEKRLKKEEEQRKMQEEKEKKARSQPTLSNFFGAASTPKKSLTVNPKQGSPMAKSPLPGDKGSKDSAYSRIFKPFFVKDHTTLARPVPDLDERTREDKSALLDKAIGGERESEIRLGMSRPLDVPDLLDLSSSRPRGRLYYPVKNIMETAYSETANAGNVDADRMNKVIAEARTKLSRVPVKVIAFSRDVRPPYYGTVTFKPYVLGQSNMRKLARHPEGRLLPLDYEYDSEAEWQEEEGEDVDMDDDEEELDDEDDMEGFLDDSEDAGLTRRIFANAMEPESTGVCFESPNSSINEVAQGHKMEFMHVSYDQNHGFNPWSTDYWETETKTKASSTSQPSDKASAMAPPPAPTNAFEALNGNNAAAVAGSGKLVKAEIMNDVKQAIVANKDLSKIGIIDIIYKKFRDSASRLEVKNTIEHVAEKTGKGRMKEWCLKAGHEVSL
ncbi:chromatin assembly factor 1 subunit A-domain-containing protein [Stachybotrys elegans]|uniref:Chromatin assembly factor 1 subunit A-domain-containing protein n=1 Tax=Stachybotrys elegans TaxID=80388 RepID=A0A8K0SR96_9HYPO|nr:chromatin assembly factor 1 subunit A-domain-containing protein [Stachybotrys elegans]